jgi:glycosyltransferase involved in cell wall biosynthesis
MKPPDHPVPSGDRRMAQLLQAALELGGHTVEVVSRLRVHDGKGDIWRQAGFRLEAAAEIARLEKRRPADAWLTYHIYHKSPDLIGPAVTQAWGRPYLVAEASVAAKGVKGPWAAFYAEALDAIRRADAVLMPNPDDREGLQAAGVATTRMHDLPPFLDAGAFAAPVACTPMTGTVRLLAVGMMRPGDKLASYAALAAALRLLADSPGWTLAIAGDGPARDDVRRLFEFLGDRVTFLGVVAEADLPAVYAAAHLKVWPAVNEAFGMALLEAQAAGLPVVSCRHRGVPAVVTDGMTGLLVEPGNTQAFAAALHRLIADDVMRQTMGMAAGEWVRRERGLERAATVLNAVLAAVTAARS